MNLTKILLKLIWDFTEIDGEKILYYAVKLLTKLLSGGNIKVQDNIYEYFNTNPMSEKFFRKIYIIMTQQINKIKQQLFRMKKEKNKLFPKILRLLQLFCEGHHLNLQQYLKYQTNSKINYDLVTLTVNSLEAFSICNDNYDNISQCFDTLTEFIQGPCYLNQFTIVNSKFLEYAVEILNVVVVF